MMDIKIRRIYRPIALAEYFGEGEEVIEVWSNPPRALRAEWAEIREESQAVTDELMQLANRKDVTDEERSDLAARLPKSNDRLFEWISKVWKFDGKETTPEEIRTFAETCEQEDEALWLFLITRTWEEINDQRDLAKKGRPTNSSRSR